MYSIYLWLYSPLLDLGRFFNFLILYIVGRTLLTGDQPVTRSLPTHGTTQAQNKRTQTCMPWLGFESTIPALELAKKSSCLGPCGHCDRHFKKLIMSQYNYCPTFVNMAWFWKPLNIGLYNRTATRKERSIISPKFCTATWLFPGNIYQV
jgi:hypothetical protein